MCNYIDIWKQHGVDAMDCLHAGDHSRVTTVQRRLHCQLSEHRGACGRSMTSMRGKRSPNMLQRTKTHSCPAEQTHLVQRDYRTKPYATCHAICKYTNDSLHTSFLHYRATIIWRWICFFQHILCLWVFSVQTLLFQVFFLTFLTSVSFQMHNANMTCM